MIRGITVAAVLLVAAVVGLDVLSDATQTRPDAADLAGATTIELAINAKPDAGSLDFVVDGLWGACQHTVKRRVQGDWEQTGPARFRGTVYPALGEHGRQRLKGCLHDVTIDRVKASVVAMERVPVCAGGGAASATPAPRCVEVRQAAG